MSRRKRIALFDYGAGNLHALSKALSAADADVVIEENPLRSLDADGLVLPGVGAFAPAAERLAPGRSAMQDAMRNGLPVLGICLGMQLLFEQSEEGGGAGLGVLEGAVSRLRAKQIPQIGWNAIDGAADVLFSRAPLPMAYFANSFVCRPANVNTVIAWSTHEQDRFPAAVRVGNVVGVQFHPEKSSLPGVRFLRAFVESIGSRS
jgi:imidazole glycerol-phosphate synthase subunit HisH